jgi:carbon-monoxide dehydrogenase medium subunit
MKPAAFSYHRPRSRDDVDRLLADNGERAKILAGGQSLMPLLNMRLAAPEHLIDINGLEGEPPGPRLDGDDLVFGPLVRQLAGERSSLVANHLPLMVETLRLVAHPPVRSRGTVVGSIVHADPAAELPAVFVLLRGRARVRSTTGRRWTAAGELYAGPLETTLQLGEWVDEVRIPVAPPGRGAAATEFAGRRGDYALCGVVAVADPAGGGAARVTLAYLGMGPVPVRLGLPELSRDEVAATTLNRRIERLVAGGLEPEDDIHATAQYRLHLARRLGARAARTAVARMHGERG